MHSLCVIWRTMNCTVSRLIAQDKLNVGRFMERLSVVGGKGKTVEAVARESREPSPVIRFFAHLFRSPDRGNTKIKKPRCTKMNCAG